jgi:hypothetical protein
MHKVSTPIPLSNFKFQGKKASSSGREGDQRINQVVPQNLSFKSGDGEVQILQESGPIEGAGDGEMPSKTSAKGLRS